MKIRHGFVSNSSSSSFIVRMKMKGLNRDFKKSELLTEEDVQKVLEYGFLSTNYSTPSALERNSEDFWEIWRQMKPVELKPNIEQLGYCVCSNEDEVIGFLVRNNIPFSASCHYGHRSVFFRRGDKKLIVLANLGVEYEMYGLSGSDPFSRSREKLMYKKSVKFYLKEVFGHEDP